MNNWHKEVVNFFTDMFGNLGGMGSGNFSEMQQQVQRELMSNPQVGKN